MREVQRERSPAVTWHPLETVNHVHMYTFPTTIQQKLLKQPEPFIHCSASQAQNAHSSAFGRWYLGFWLTYRFKHRYGILNYRPEVLRWKQRSSPENVFLHVCRHHPHGKTTGEEREREIRQIALMQGLYTHRLLLVPLLSPPSGSRVHPDSSSLTANAALCHSVHWLSYLPICHSWIGTSLAWNLLSDFVRVTWDAWCCNCSAFGNGGSVANVFRVILTYLLRLVLQFTALWWI